MSKLFLIYHKTFRHVKHGKTTTHMVRSVTQKKSKQQTQFESVNV